jgi:hypothetical protein
VKIDVADDRSRQEAPYVSSTPDTHGQQTQNETTGVNVASTQHRSFCDMLKVRHLNRELCGLVEYMNWELQWMQLTVITPCYRKLHVKITFEDIVML